MGHVRVGVIGATGYAGAELVRLLIQHPRLQLTALSSTSFCGRPFVDVYPTYRSLCHLHCMDQEYVLQHCDLVFAALPHGHSEDLAAKCHTRGILLIDLGADFRLHHEEDYKEWYGQDFTHAALRQKAVYGLPELFREHIRHAQLIANPGCYPTAVSLALAPALHASFIDPGWLVADCKSGITGAGRIPTAQSHYPELNEACYAYKVGQHRHTPEIEQVLSSVADCSLRITFTPHILPVNRGILATCYAKLYDGVDVLMVHAAYTEYYKQEYFVRILPEKGSANIHHVKYSNFCDISIHVDQHTRMLVVTSALDNMVKGAAGQAIQNANILYGIPEHEGLMMIPPAF